MKRTCIVNNDYPAIDLFRAAAHAQAHPPFDRQVASFLCADACLLTSCGFSALTIILDALRELHPGKHEVVIPAYTAPGLVLPIRRCGLEPVLCDISLETFSLDPARLSDIVSPATLAIIGVDLFGIPADFSAIREAAGPEMPIIDDCAQAMGSERAGVKAGMLGDVGFTSFGRGKNFSIYGGGCIILRASPLATTVRKRFEGLPQGSSADGIASIIKGVVFAGLTSPVMYHYTAALLAGIKPAREQQSFSTRALSPLAGSYGQALFPHWRAVYDSRVRAGEAYRELLTNDEGILIPAMPPHCRIAFNRFPMLVKHSGRRAALMARFSHAGIDASPLYGAPVHRLHEVTVRPGGYPAAEYFAEHLITLPAHGQVTREDIGSAAELVRASRQRAEGGRA